MKERGGRMRGLRVFKKLSPFKLKIPIDKRGARRYNSANNSTASKPLRKKSTL